MARRRRRYIFAGDRLNVGDLALILLAAGRSERFGANKLAADLGGMPLCHHAAKMLGGFGFTRKVAVVENASHRLEDLGFEIVRTGPGDASMAKSIAAGVAVIATTNPAGILLTLADMPFVPSIHIERLVRRFDGNIVASSANEIPQPPAIFGPQHFEALIRLNGDRGARDLLRLASLIEAPGEWLADIDTPTELTRAREFQQSGGLHLSHRHDMIGMSQPKDK